MKEIFDTSTKFTTFLLFSYGSDCVELSRGALNGVMTEFQEKLRQQHENSMHKELEKLLSTAKDAEAEVRLEKQTSLCLTGPLNVQSCCECGGYDLKDNGVM